MCREKEGREEERRQAIKSSYSSALYQSTSSSGIIINASECWFEKSIGLSIIGCLTNGTKGTGGKRDTESISACEYDRVLSRLKRNAPYTSIHRSINAVFSYEFPQAWNISLSKGRTTIGTIVKLYSLDFVTAAMSPSKHLSVVTFSAIANRTTKQLNLLRQLYRNNVADLIVKIRSQWRLIVLSFE